MAKDDYFVIVYKILAYLYVQLKNGNQIEERMISNDGPLFQINKKYWTYIIIHMISQGFIEGPSVTSAWGGVQIIEDLGKSMITPKGIEYLFDNSLLEKAKQFLKDIKEITPFI